MLIPFPFRAGRLARPAERTYLVAYDIGDRRRWRKVHKLMVGHGDWLQLSVFRCRLSDRRRDALVAALTRIIEPGDDHVLVFDLGDTTGRAAISLGREDMPLQPGATVV